MKGQLNGIALSPAQLARLHANHTENLYVRMADAEALQSYLDEIIDVAAHDESLSAQRRSEVLHSAAQGVMADVMTHPNAVNVYSRGARLAGNVIHMILTCPGGLRCMTQLFSNDYYTYTHSVQVCILGSGLCRRIEAGGPERLKRLATGLLLHDLGKALIPKSILNKPGRLSPDERLVMETHPTLGYELFRRQEGPSQAMLSIVLEHHEKPDGSGYPNGLRGDGLGLPSRIANVVDVFDALTSARPYRPAMPFERAVAIMDEDAGNGKMDPDVLGSLKAMVSTLDLVPRSGDTAVPDA